MGKLGPIDRLYWIPFLIAALAAVSDIIGCYPFNIYGFNEQYWWGYANAVYVLWYSFPIILGLVYYILVRDFSESLVLSVGTLILYAFGWEDLLFYIIGFPIYGPLHKPWIAIPWCDWPRPMGLVQFILGLKHNNLFALAINALIGAAVYDLFFKLMRKVEARVWLDGFRLEI